MNEETIKILEKQQAIILGEIELIRKTYSGHVTLNSTLMIIEECVHTTMDYLNEERNRVNEKGGE